MKRNRMETLQEEIKETYNALKRLKEEEQKIIVECVHTDITETIKPRWFSDEDSNVISKNIVKYKCNECKQKLNNSHIKDEKYITKTIRLNIEPECRNIEPEYRNKQ